MDEGTHRYGRRDLYSTSAHTGPRPDISNKAPSVERDGHFEREATRSIGLLACGGAQTVRTILCAGRSKCHPRERIATSECVTDSAGSIEAKCGEREIPGLGEDEGVEMGGEWRWVNDVPLSCATI